LRALKSNTECSAKRLTFLPHMQIALFVSSFDAVRPGWLLNFLKGISVARIKEITQGISCILVQLNHWVLKTWFEEWF
ncbi:hypothetical protein S83_029365, partial [Arachis hypogaea]